MCPLHQESAPSAHTEQNLLLFTVGGKKCWVKCCFCDILNNRCNQLETLGQKCITLKALCDSHKTSNQPCKF